MAGRPHLWMTTGSAGPVRFFLIPRGLRLPEGRVTIRNMQLGTLHVEAEALDAFEVDRAAAQAHIDAGWGAFVGQVRGAWNDLLGRERGASSPPDLGALLGATPGQLLVDEEKRRESGRSLLSRAGALFGQRLDDQQLDDIENRIKGFGSTLVRESSRLAGNLERAADAAVDAVRDAARGPADSPGGRRERTETPRERDPSPEDEESGT